MVPLLLLSLLVSAYSEQQCSCTSGTLEESFATAREVFLGIVMDQWGSTMVVGVVESFKGSLLRNQKVQVSYGCGYFPIPSTNTSLFFTTVPNYPKNIASVSLIPCTKNGACTTADLRYLRSLPITCDVSTLPSPPKTHLTSKQVSDGTIIEVDCNNYCHCTRGDFKCTTLSCTRYPCGKHKDGETWTTDCTTFYCNNSITVSFPAQHCQPAISTSTIILIALVFSFLVFLSCVGIFVVWLRKKTSEEREEWDGDEMEDSDGSLGSDSSSTDAYDNGRVTNTNIISTVNNGNTYNHIYTMAPTATQFGSAYPGVGGYAHPQQMVYMPNQQMAQPVPVYLMTQNGLVNSNQVAYI